MNLAGARMAENVELRVMPSGNGSWYWEVITPGPTAVWQILNPARANRPAKPLEKPD